MKACLKKYKLLLIVTIALSILSSTAYVYIAIILQQVTDTALSGDMNKFRDVILGAVLYLVLIGVLGIVCTAVGKRLTRSLMGYLRTLVFRGVLRHTPQDFSSVDTAQYLSALTNDMKLVEDNLIVPLLLSLQQAVLFVAALVVLFTISPVIALCLIGFLVLMLCVPALFGKALQKRQDALSLAMAAFTKKTKDLLAGYEVIKCYLLDRPVQADYDSENKQLIRAAARSDRVNAANESVSEVLAYFTLFSGIFIGAYMVIMGSITAGVLLALIQLSSSFVTPLMVIMQSAPRMQGVMPVLNRLEKLANYQDTALQGTLPATLTSQIAVENLCFSYDDAQPVLKGVTMTIKKGKKIAVTGRSGCGKTTLIRLLSGDLQGFSGSIQYDGNEIQTLLPDSLRRLLSVIHQKVTLFCGSIRHNICLYNSYTDHELDAALQGSGLQPMIARLPDGLEVHTGENGASLSGGERQRIAVARALIRKTPLLILDEGTSSIDRQTAYDIEHRLLSRDDLTLISITHNMSAESLRLYDEIFYLEDGRVAEHGHLDDLLESQGAFSRFFHVVAQ